MQSYGRTSTTCAVSADRWLVRLPQLQVPLKGLIAFLVGSNKLENMVGHELTLLTIDSVVSFVSTPL